MPQVWKNRFKQLCTDFSDIITPIPGKYNGSFGHVSTAINFSSPPPSNLRTYLQKYSYNMMKILSDKMDALEQWGVLFCSVGGALFNKQGSTISDPNTHNIKHTPHT